MRGRGIWREGIGGEVSWAELTRLLLGANCSVSKEALAIVGVYRQVLYLIEGRN